MFINSHSNNNHFWDSALGLKLDFCFAGLELKQDCCQTCHADGKKCVFHGNNDQVTMKASDMRGGVRASLPRNSCVIRARNGKPKPGVRSSYWFQILLLLLVTGQASCRHENNRPPRPPPIPFTLAPSKSTTLAPSTLPFLTPTTPSSQSPSKSSTLAPSTPPLLPPTTPSSQAPSKSSTLAPSTPPLLPPTTPSIPPLLPPTTPCTHTPSKSSTRTPSTPPLLPPTTPSTQAPSTPSTLAPSNTSTLSPYTPSTLTPSTPPLLPPTTPSTPPLLPPTTPSTPPLVPLSTQAPSTLSPSTPPLLLPTTPSTQAPFTQSTPSTQAPSTPSTKAPSTQAPSNTSTLAPPTPPLLTQSTTSTLTPSKPSTLVPSNTSTQAPSNTSTLAPSHTSTLAPSNTSILTPSKPSTLALSNTSTLAPSHTSTLAPSNTSTLAPTNTSTLVPTNTSTLTLSTPSTLASSTPAPTTTTANNSTTPESTSKTTSSPAYTTVTSNTPHTTETTHGHCNVTQPCTNESVYYWMEVTVDLFGDEKNESDINDWLYRLFENDLDSCLPRKYKEPNTTDSPLPSTTYVSPSADPTLTSLETNRTTSTAPYNFTTTTTYNSATTSHTNNVATTKLDSTATTTKLKTTATPTMTTTSNYMTTPYNLTTTKATMYNLATTKATTFQTSTKTINLRQRAAVEFLTTATTTKFTTTPTPTMTTISNYTTTPYNLTTTKATNFTTTKATRYNSTTTKASTDNFSTTMTTTLNETLDVNYTTTLRGPSSTTSEMTGAHLFQGIEVVCVNKTGFRKTNCSVLLKLRQPTHPCCILRTLCQGGNSSLQAHVVGTRVDRAGRTSRNDKMKCNDSVQYPPACIYSGSTNSSCSQEDVQPYVPPWTNSTGCGERTGGGQNKMSCNCSAYCNGTDAYYYLQISIQDPSITFANISSQISKLKNPVNPPPCTLETGIVCPSPAIASAYQDAHLDCGGGTTNLQSCDVILSFAREVPVCDVSAAAMAVLSSAKDIDYNGQVTRAAICSHSRAAGNPLQSNFTFVSIDSLPPSDFCSPDVAELTATYTCPKGRSVCILLDEQCNRIIPSAPTTPSSSTTTPVPINTTVLQNTTSISVNATSSPLNTTSPAPVNATSSPLNTTSPAPVNSTSSPLNTTSPAPVNATSSPLNTTSPAPVNTTSSPLNTTSPAPVNSTSSPLNTTSPAPVNTTSFPLNTTSSAPVNATSSPLNMTSSAPANTTSYPLNTTSSTPANSSATPLNNTISAPANTTSFPLNTTSSAPVNTTATALNTMSTTSSPHNIITAAGKTTVTTVQPNKPTTTTTTTTTTTGDPLKPTGNPTNASTTIIESPTTTGGSNEQAADRLLELTKDVSKLNSSQVEQLVSELEALLSGPNVSLALGNTSINIVSNLLDAPSETVASSSKRLIGIVDTVGLKLVFPGDTETILSRALALSVKTVDGGNFEETTFSISDPKTVQVRGDRRARSVRETSTVPQASVRLPPSLTQHLSSQEQQQASRVQFNFYQKNTLFQDKSLGTQRRLISGIVGASVANLTITGLKEDVYIHLKISEPIPANFVATCVFWDFSRNDGAGGWNPFGCHVRNSTDNVTTCGCDHLTSFAILLDIARETLVSRINATILTYITYIGCGISAIFLSITLLTYMSFGKLHKDIRAKILMQQCLSLLLLNLTFLVDAWLALYPEAVGLCISTAWFLHYFLLASFAWMGLQGVHMYLSLVKVFNTYIANHMLKLSLVGWGVPLIVVIIVIAIDKDNYGLVTYAKYTDGTSDDFCWLKNDIAFYVAVVAYFCVIFVFNCSMFVVVMVQLCRIKKQNPHNQQQRSALQDVRSVMGITMLLGLTWGFAFFAWGPVSLAFMYLFAIFNSFQGFFIFVFHCAVKENVRKQWRTYLCCGNLRLLENSEWSRTATQKTWSHTQSTGQTRHSSASRSNNSSSPSSLLVNDPSSEPFNGIGNPIDDRAITANEEPRSDVILNEINSQYRNQQTP